MAALISTKGRYALRAMVDLAQNKDAGLVPLADIARRQGISEKYLESIVSALSKAGFISGQRGKGGGYKLTREPAEYSLGEIVRLVEGRIQRDVPGRMQQPLHAARLVQDAHHVGGARPPDQLLLGRQDARGPCRWRRPAHERLAELSVSLAIGFCPDYMASWGRTCPPQAAALRYSDCPLSSQPGGGL